MGFLQCLRCTTLSVECQRPAVPNKRNPNRCVRCTQDKERCYYQTNHKSRATTPAAPKSRATTPAPKSRATTPVTKDLKRKRADSSSVETVDMEQENKLLRSKLKLYEAEIEYLNKTLSAEREFLSATKLLLKSIHEG